MTGKRAPIIQSPRKAQNPTPEITKCRDDSRSPTITFESEEGNGTTFTVTLFAFMGFPGETKEEAQATRDFVVNHTELYTGCALHRIKPT
ncbi:MAG: hypothetical protein ACXVIA_07255 [Halobacteriota archaeon]